MTQLNQPSTRVHRDSPLLHAKTFRITSFADPAPQLPWNDILAKKQGVASRSNLIADNLDCKSLANGRKKLG